MVALVAAACGGTAKPDSTAKPEVGEGAHPSAMGEGHQTEGHGMGEGHQKGHGGEKHEMAMPPQIVKFHDTLAPRWHAKPGTQRMTDTCAAMPEFRADASAIAAAQAPPSSDSAAWSTRGKQLSDAVGALEATCKGKDAVAFEPAFERVHSTFHGLMEVAGGSEHGKAEHGKAEHGKEHSEHKNAP